MSLTETSKFISLILRHKPSVIGIELDEHGWANVSQLIENINRQTVLTMAQLEEIVASDDKQRYSFNEDKTLIRANQGHSVPVDLDLQELMPPDILYHGTGKKYVSSINVFGLIPKSRLYVHLSSDISTAVTVGKRHGIPIIYAIDCKQMYFDGYKFYQSANGVWLTKSVPIEYLDIEC